MKPELPKTYTRITKILLLTVFAFYLYVPLKAQTFFGTSSTPADNGTQSGTTATVVPPASMLTGDLVIIYAHYRNTSGTFSISTTGGQTWNTGSTTTGSNQAYFIAWCRFSGTWMTDPVVTGSGSSSVALTAVMYVFRPTNPLNRWGVNVTQTNNSSSGSNPNTINSVTTTLPNTVTMAFWCSGAANTWGTLTGTDWSKTGLTDQVRNTTGSDQSQTAAYKIMSAAGTTGDVSQTQSSTTTALKTIMSWHEVPNDNCANATSVTVNTGTTCTATTTSTTTGATQSATGCSGTADDDVWFSFIATDYQHTITATPAASGGISNIVLEVFSNCSGTSFGCVNATSGTSAESTTLYGLTPGATYYYRVYSSASGSGTGLFTTCVTTALPATPANVSTGKSFINITRPGGGTIVPGDELEIRVSVNVSNAGNNNIFRLRYNDTLPSNVTYVPGSLKLLTNEAKVYAAYTDNAGDDAAMYNSVNRTIRFNLGRDTTNQSRGVVSNTGNDSTGGGYVRSNTHAPRGNGMLVIVTYRVTVDASTSYNTIINYGSGTIRYRNQLPATGAINYTLAPNTLSFIVYPNYGLCSNATGSNSITAGNGDFGSGTTQNASNPGTVPGYTYLSIAANAPNDGSYSVIKNLSPNELTDPTVARPNTTSGNRVFGVWDIIGDHTGASDPLAGNPPSSNVATGGYMLAVNAAYQLSVANNQTITGLCENTYYEFSAWFRNVCKRCGSDSLGRGASSTSPPAGYIPTAPGDSSGVKPNLTFQIDGIDYYVSGDIDYTGQWGQWVKKGFVFRTEAGQTSLTISIKNNAPGGGGNDWVMDDISFVTCLPNLQFYPTASNQICANSVVQVSSVVNTFFDNYKYYQWEQSTDNGATWVPATLQSAVDSFQYASSGGSYIDTVYYPQFIANSSQNGYQYRLRVATTLDNLTNNDCNVYQATEIVTLNIITNCTVLPADVLKFNVQLNGDKTVLTWHAKENQLKSYTVERSDNGINFHSIGYVSAKGTGNNEVSYRFNDPVSVSGKVYYRLKLDHLTGNTTYSNTLTVVTAQSQMMEVTNLVNPFRERISFQLNAVRNEEVQLQLADALGHPILTKKIQVFKGSNAVAFEASHHLAKGSYVLRIISASGTVNKIIQKQ